MILILEGPDCSGKTCLSKALMKDNYNIRYYHAIHKFAYCTPAYCHALLKKAVVNHANGKHTILDRWWISEYIYADAFRGGTKWLTLGNSLVKMGLLLQELNIPITYIFCFNMDKEAYLSTVQNELAKGRKEMFTDIEKIWHLYHEFMFGKVSFKKRNNYLDYVFSQGFFNIYPQTFIYDYMQLELAASLLAYFKQIMEGEVC